MRQLGADIKELSSSIQPILALKLAAATRFAGRFTDLIDDDSGRFKIDEISDLPKFTRQRRPPYRISREAHFKTRQLQWPF